MPPKVLAEEIAAFLGERRRLGHRDFPGFSAYPRALRLLDEKVTSRLRREGRRPSKALTADLTREDLGAVLDVYLERGVTQKTLSLAASALRVFCRWLHRKGAILLDPACDLKVGKGESRVGYVPSRQEVERLLAAAEEARREDLAIGQRDLTMLELLYGSALRLRELLRLDVTDLDLHERVVFVRGKGGKERLVPLTDASVCALRLYLQKARPLLAVPRVCSSSSVLSPPLFLSAKGARLSVDWPRLSLRQLVKAANLPRELTPHRLRHACAVHLLEAGADVVHIARLLGHSSLRTTAIYLSLSPGEVRRAHSAAHPRG